VSAVAGPYVSLLSLNNPLTKKKVMGNIVNILCSNLPIARKLLADKLLLLVMSQKEGEVFSEDCSEVLMGILSDNDFLEEKLDVKGLRKEI
jgi:hypothetical protein